MEYILMPTTLPIIYIYYISTFHHPHSSGRVVLVIEGPVAGTGKKPEPDQTTTGRNRTFGSVEPHLGTGTGCSCSNACLTQTGCNRTMVPVLGESEKKATNYPKHT